MKGIDVSHIGVAKMASLSHRMRNPNILVLRLVLSGRLLEPPRAFLGFLGSPGKLLGALWSLLGLLLGASWVFLGAS
jgi:predicted permease